MRTVLATLVTSAVVGVAHPARAEPMVIVLLRPPASGASDAGVVNRLRGELLADGFAVQVVDAMPGADPVATVTGTGHAAGTAVAAGLWVAGGARTVELILVDELTGRVLVRQLDVDADSPEEAPEVTARRSVDFLRAGLLDFLVESRRAAVAAAPALPPVVRAAGASDRMDDSRWAVEAGLGVLASFEGVGPAIVPVARARFAATPTLQLQATTAWLGTRPLLQTPAGTASIDQGVALLECSAHLWRSRPLRPFASLGAGTYYVGVSGNGDTPYRSERSASFAFAFDAGLGVSLPLGPHFEMVLEAQAIVVDPGIAIRLLDVEAGRVGRPSILATLTAAGWI